MWKCNTSMPISGIYYNVYIQPASTQNKLPILVSSYTNFAYTCTTHIHRIQNAICKLYSMHELANDTCFLFLVFAQQKGNGHNCVCLPLFIGLHNRKEMCILYIYPPSIFGCFAQQKGKVYSSSPTVSWWRTTCTVYELWHLHAMTVCVLFFGC